MVEQEGADRPETITHFTHPERHGEPLNAGRTLQVEQVETFRASKARIMAEELVRLLGPMLPIEVATILQTAPSIEDARHRIADIAASRLPTNSVDVEQRARELLAAEFRKAGFEPHSWIVDGTPVDQWRGSRPLYFRAIQSALSGSRLSNEGVRLREALEPFARMGELIELETTGFDDTDQFSLITEDGHLLDRFEVGDFRRARQALASLQPASLSEERMALEPARPLIEAIAAWERKNGTIAAIMPHEYTGFMETLKKAAVHGSARAALARGKKNG
jgi:hypothetical protein